MYSSMAPWDFYHIPWRRCLTMAGNRVILNKPVFLPPRFLEIAVTARGNKFRQYTKDTRKFNAQNRNYTEENPVNRSFTDRSFAESFFTGELDEKLRKPTDHDDTSSLAVQINVDGTENSNSESNSQKPPEDIEPPEDFEEHPGPRPPRAVQAAYLRPLRRRATYNIPVCDLQLRSYSVRNVEFMADFALRAAYFLDLPASGPIPLPQITERWTVPKAHFIHKKVQENFERKTLRRLIQIKDGAPEVVRLWLGFLRKHAYYGVGMKANVWEFASINVSKDMDSALEQNRPEIEPLLAQYAFKGSHYGEKIVEIANRENRWQASGGGAPMINPPNWRKPLN